MGTFQSMNVYISGPMTGMTDLNRDAFNRMADLLKSRGHSVYNPARLIGRGFSRAECIRRDVAALTRLNDDGTPFFDLMVNLPRWIKSTGAKMEMLLADCIGVPHVDAFVIERDIALGKPIERFGWRACGLKVSTDEL